MQLLVPLEELKDLGWDAFKARVAAGERVSSFFEHENRLVCVTGNGTDLEIISTQAPREYESMTVVTPRMHMFERELYEESKIVPRNHPWLKPVRFMNEPVGAIHYFSIADSAIHEVGVGPVHAGIIEPGHFRFICHGEKVHHLEISLGYQHRGIEHHLKGGPGKKTLYYMENIAGDTVIGHAWTYAKNRELLSGIQPGPNTVMLRSIMLELERMANHIGDLGALAGDVGFLPALSFCGRIRGDFLNLSASVCGSRFGKGFMRPGRDAFNVPDKKEFIAGLDAAYKDAGGAVGLLFKSKTVAARFRKTGVLTGQQARELGIVGPAARASGVNNDVRASENGYSSMKIPLLDAGDVFARAMIRWLEVEASYQYIKEVIETIGPPEAGPEAGACRPESIAVSMTEAWRGEVCHVAVTDKEGRFAKYKVVDPSFHNWNALSLVLRGEGISDFPLCNKSFNLSYCGFDR